MLQIVQIFFLVKKHMASVFFDINRTGQASKWDGNPQWAMDCNHQFNLLSRLNRHQIFENLTSDVPLAAWQVRASEPPPRHSCATGQTIVSDTARALCSRSYSPAQQTTTKKLSEGVSSHAMSYSLPIVQRTGKKSRL
jgi:hypothetical protein